MPLSQISVTYTPLNPIPEEPGLGAAAAAALHHCGDQLATIRTHNVDGALAESIREVGRCHRRRRRLMVCAHLGCNSTDV